MIDMEEIAGNLRLSPDGIWRSGTSSSISYPSEGNDHCLAIEENSFWFRHRNACLVEMFRQFPPPGVLFDVGGGNGFVSRALIDAGVNVVLVEPGADGVRNAKARGIPTLVHSTLEDAQFRPETLPAVGMFDVLEHLEDDLGVLRSLHSYLVPSGRLYLTVPAFRFLWSDEDDAAGHFRRYTLSLLASRLRQTGFEVEFQTYFFAPLPLPIFLFRTIPSMLKIRKPSQERSESEHSGGGGGLGTILNGTLDRELRRIKAGKRILFGGSCLVVARKRR
jgi:SAM-dependent methyltransferase